MVAKEQGYRVLKLYEVWHFPDDTQYDKQSNSGGLFTNYVQLFLKIKQEASGFPNTVGQRKKNENTFDFIKKMKALT